MDNPDELSKALRAMIMPEVGPDDLSESDYSEDDDDQGSGESGDDDDDDDEQLQPQAKKAKGGSGGRAAPEDTAVSFDVPTADEQMALRTADDMLVSSSGNHLLTLQVDELLSEARLGRSGDSSSGGGGAGELEDVDSLRGWLFRFRDFVLGMPSKSLSSSSFAAEGVFPGLARCLSPHARLSSGLPAVELDFQPPTRCDVVGSLITGTLSRPDR